MARHCQRRAGATPANCWRSTGSFPSFRWPSPPGSRSTERGRSRTCDSEAMRLAVDRERAPQWNGAAPALLLFGAAAALVMGSELFHVVDIFGGALRRMEHRLQTLLSGLAVLLAVVGGFALCFVTVRWDRSKVSGRVGLTAWGVALALLSAPPSTIRRRGKRRAPESSRASRWTACLSQGAVARRLRSRALGAGQHGARRRDPRGRHRSLGESVCNDWSPDLARIASATGRPTILGWEGHERQWRSAGSVDFGGLQDDVRRIYETEDPRHSRRAVDEHGVDYVVVGPRERAVYGGEGERKFAALGTVVSKTEASRSTASTQRGLPDVRTLRTALAEAWRSAAFAMRLAPARIAAVRPPRTWEGWAVLVLIALALGTRLWDLGGRVLHYDEVLHALYSWTYSTGGGLSAQSAHARPVPVSRGRGHLQDHWGERFRREAASRPLRRGARRDAVALPPRIGALRRARGLALPAHLPHILYFSRFMRNDVYMAVWAVVLLALALRYLERPRGWMLFAWAAVWALAFATKESAFFLAECSACCCSSSRRARFGNGCGTTARSRGSGPASDLLIVMGTLILPMWAPAAGLFQRFAGVILVTPT